MGKLICGFTYKELFELAIEKPIMAQLEITRNCNQKCFFCFRACNPKLKFPDRSLSDWEVAIDKLIDIGVRELNFSGGEIFLFKDISSLFKYAKVKGIQKIVVNTNGLADLTRDKLCNIDEIVFSVHGIGEDHDQATGVPGSFKKINRAIKKAMDYQCRVGINTVVTTGNYLKLDSIYDFYKNYPLAFHCFNLFIDRENLSNRREEYSRIIPKYLRFLKTIPVSKRKLRHGLQNILIDDRGYYQGDIPLPHCAGGKYKVVVDYKGDVYPCRYFQSSEYFCGNVFDDDLARTWSKGKGFRIFRDFVLEEKTGKSCHRCLKKKKCVGGCLAWRTFNNLSKVYEEDIRCQFGHAYIRS